MSTSTKVVEAARAIVNEAYIDTAGYRVVPEDAFEPSRHTTPAAPR
jgi:hypothetical protein